LAAPNRYILAVDQGTTKTKAVLFDQRGRVCGFGASPVPRSFPNPGWVEQDPEVIWTSVLSACKKAMRDASCSPRQIVAVGIDDQGETVVMWNKRTSKPLHNAVVWQCRRTAGACEKLKKNKGLEVEIKKRTGLIIDPYFSATKIRWILDNAKGAKTLARRGEALFGTTDTWVVWKMSRGRYFATDCATASRTMLFNIHRMEWDSDLLHIFRVSDSLLAEVHPNSGEIAHTDPKAFLGIDAPISGLIVDQQSALFGHGCFSKGDSKNTYGTGCFMLMNTGSKPKTSRNGLLTTVAWVINGERTYALDGGVYVAGSAIDWLVRLGIIANPEKTNRLAYSVSNNQGVYFVPAFVGLAAPYWDSYARGTMLGLSDGTTRAHIVRATLESIAFQVNEVLGCMEADARLKVNKLRVDGGPTSNEYLMQFQANISGMPVEVPHVREVTARGAAFLAGLGVDFWSNLSDLHRLGRSRLYQPRMREEERAKLLYGWRRAVERARNWARETA
jgi:glycerol kinase